MTISFRHNYDKQADVAPFRVNTPAEFVAFLNSLRAPFWQRATLESEMAVITLRKLWK